MKLLIDTQIFLWASVASPKLSPRATTLLNEHSGNLLYSPLGLAEIVMKRAKGYQDFQFDAERVRRGLLANGYVELPLTSLHAARLGHLPPIHKDPFDRLMIAQALAEGVPFVTADAVLAAYPGQVVVV